MSDCSGPKLYFLPESIRYICYINIGLSLSNIYKVSHNFLSMSVRTSCSIYNSRLWRLFSYRKNFRTYLCRTNTVKEAGIFYFLFNLKDSQVFINKAVVIIYTMFNFIKPVIFYYRPNIISILHTHSQLGWSHPRVNPMN